MSITKTFKVVLKNAPGSWPDWCWSVFVKADNESTAMEMAIEKMAHTMFPKTDFIVAGVQQQKSIDDAVG